MTRTALVRTDRYGRVAIAFHWSIAALVLANLPLGILHDKLLDGIVWVMPLHQAIGLTVLALTLARLGWRLGHRAPPLPAALPQWQRRGAGMVHWGLYALMLVMPLSGWLMVSGGAHARPISWFGLARVPALPGISHAAGAAANGVHSVLGLAMLSLVVLHIGAALWHQYGRRDAVLARMVPGLKPRG